MNVALLERRFGRIGARVKVGEAAGRAGVGIGRDDEGEFFDIRLAAGERVEYVVVDVRAEARHLLLMERRAGARRRFLCGRGESRWFVNAVPPTPRRAGAVVARRTPAADEAAARIRRRLARIKSRLRR